MNVEDSILTSTLATARSLQSYVERDVDARADVLAWHKLFGLLTRVDARFHLFGRFGFHEKRES